MAGIKDVELGVLMAEVKSRLDEYGCAYLIAVQKDPNIRPGLMGQVVWNFPPGTEPSMTLSAYALEFGAPAMFMAILPKGKWEQLNKEQVDRKRGEVEQSEGRVEFKELAIARYGCILDGKNLYNEPL
jgi:hypothetical protein